MIKLLTATVVTVALVSTSSACWFPFFPTYSAGYAGWGYPAPAYNYASYAPSFGYQQSYGYSPISYGVPYSASYGGFSSTCCNTCGLSSCCGTCGNSGAIGFASYGSGCASDCVSANCIPSDVVNKPVPDSVGGGAADDRRDLPKTYEPPQAKDPLDDRAPWPGDRTPALDGGRGDDFGRGRSEGAGTGSDRGLPNPTDGWGSGRPGGASDGGGMFDELDRNGRKVPMSDPELSEPALIDQTGYKPPMSDPMKLEEGTGEEASPATEDPDLIAPEAPVESALRSSIFYASNTNFRSSHFDVLRPQRTVGNSNQRAPVTQISTSKKIQQAPRWISVPMPVGRERI